jgi:hypothetical protein
MAEQVNAFTVNNPRKRTRVSNRRTGSRVRCPTLADGEGKVG